MKIKKKVEKLEAIRYFALRHQEKEIFNFVEKAKIQEIIDYEKGNNRYTLKILEDFSSESLTVQSGQWLIKTIALNGDINYSVMSDNKFKCLYEEDK